ncbi:MAG TPA: hydrogenase expression/formation protein HypE [Nitrospiraceae bacterium]|jgi:hydrogenase expression/formation protein HypE|nr:hydrogenase expression/formation protein HypE [Nitrospiraceae bacterium]
MSDDHSLELSCPLPTLRQQTIALAHGGGGRLMQELIRQTFLPAFDNAWLAQLHDGAVLPVDGGQLAFTTDSYVVQPLFFPGGDIGRLAVYGTVNDLAMCGAKPLYLSAGFILEEGLPLETLMRVVTSMAEAAQAAGVAVVTGDTKVVDRGKGDGMFINTAGVGLVLQEAAVAPQRVRSGDAILLSGDLGRHGLAVLSVREGLAFAGDIRSDSAPVHTVVEDLLSSGIEVHCLRDLTRGGLASALNEIAAAARVAMAVDERAIPVSEPVRGACELLGLDPLYVANEGRFVAFVPESEAYKALTIMRRHEVSQGAAIIGRVMDSEERAVVLMTVLGTKRFLDLLSGEQLPRIC